MLFGAELASEMPGVTAGLYDPQRQTQGPKRPFKEKVLRLAKSLVVRPPAQEASTKDGGDQADAPADNESNETARTN